MAPRLPTFNKINDEDLSDAPKGKWKDGIVAPVNDLIDSNKSLTNKGITLSNNVMCEQKSFDILVPDAWTLLTPINSWATNGVPLRITKHPDGTVELQGDLSGGASNTVLAAGTIPQQYRPQYDMRFVSARGGGYATFTVDSDGSLTQTSGTDGSFNCRFLASDAAPISNARFPILISTEYPKKPAAVLVSKIEDITTTNPKPLGTAMTIDWDYSGVGGKPSIVIKNLTGLPYNRKYRVHLIIFGE